MKAFLGWLRRHRPAIFLFALVTGMVTGAALYIAAENNWTSLTWILLGVLGLSYTLVMGTK